MMSYDRFFDALGRIYATFGKKVPQTEVIERIYDRVCKLPEGFLEYTVQYFEDQDDLPKNMGKFLLRVLWPDYLIKHPELKSTQEISACPVCDPGKPGWRRVYMPERTGWGQSVYRPVHVRCTCGSYPNPDQDKIYTDWELEDMGYLLECPYPWDKYNPPEFLRKAIRFDDTVREEHKACIDIMEYGDW